MSLTNCTFTGYIRGEGWSPNRKPDLRRRAEGEGKFTCRMLIRIQTFQSTDLDPCIS